MQIKILQHECPFLLRGELYCKCCTQMLRFFWEDMRMNKTISMSIRVSEEELDKLKQAARLEAYASYSEFIRRTALIEAEKVIRENKDKKENY